MRVMSDPATAEIPAQRRNACEPSLLLIMLSALSAVGTGPESAPPARTIQPLAPRFNGSSPGCCRLSIRQPAQDSKIAAPSPSIYRARLLRCPNISSSPTAADNPDATTAIGTFPTF